VKRIRSFLKKKLWGISLDAKIRLSYLVVIAPLVIFLIFCLTNLWRVNIRYDNMLASRVEDPALIIRLREDIQLYYSQMITITIAVFFMLLLVIALVSYKVSRLITDPIKRISRISQRVARGELDLSIPDEDGYELAELGRSINTMVYRTNELIRQVTKEQTSLRKAELELMQSQINPHFLYNTLDTIIWLSEAGDGESVVKMAGSLSEFFRTSLSQGRDIINLSEEIKHVMSYLKIQQVRYQDIMDYSVDIPESLYGQEIPKITIQPLVENALYHGIKNRRGGGKISIWAAREGSFFRIYVKDNGIGMKPDRLRQITEMLGNIGGEDREAFGLANVNERIRLKFGNRCGIHIDSEYMVGTTVTVLLPYRQTGKES
jgi:two-component system sensor histidine kinase YesM